MKLKNVGMKNYPIQYVFVICLYAVTILGFASCHCDKALEETLSLAGSNRPELEKVLEYYRDDPEPLKLEAAKFLIRNMPGHKSYTGDEITKYYKEIDRILNTDTTTEYKNQQIEGVATQFSRIKFQESEDVKIISADYLIKNINRAFVKWQTTVWAEHLTFDQFCELVLPYKCFDYQQLDNWKDTLSVRYGNVMESVLGDDFYARSVHKAASTVNREVYSSYKSTYRKATKKPDGYPLLNESIAKIHPADCYEAAMLTVMAMRSHGIPIAMDHLPQWGRKGNRHIWYTLLSDNGKFLPFPQGLTSNPGDISFPYDAIPKVYRSTYAADRKRSEYLKYTKYKYPSFGKFEQDVTSEYVKTSDLSIPLINRKVKDKYVYLATSDYQSWEVVDFGSVNNNCAKFTNVGRGIAYLVLGYDGTKLFPVSHPFLLKKNGELEYLAADTLRQREMYLSRKYPKKDGTVKMENRIVGGEIHASNDKKFAHYDSLYTITDFSFPDRIPLIASDKYRYWRYYSGKDGYCNIAELQFYDEGTDTVAIGNIIGMEKIDTNGSDKEREKAFDGDWLTCFQSKQASGDWVGLDFGKPVSIDRVRCVPRSDDNGIHFGDTYELMYWGENKWVSLGIKKADERCLFYNSVPTNALLLLENHTRGREERIFTYEDEKQIWW